MSFYNNTEDLIKSKGFEIISKDFERPWGGFLVIEESQAQDFSNQFFKGINVDSLKIRKKPIVKQVEEEECLHCSA